MTLPRRQRRLLRSIGNQLGNGDPQLARQLRAFGQLAGQEPLPASEQLPAGPGRFWSALLDALDALAWLTPELYLGADAGRSRMPGATFAPGLPRPRSSYPPAVSRRPAGGARPEW
jgi:hypothetical protein